MTRKFGFGIIGAGMAVKPHVQSLKDLRGGVEVRGAYTRNEVTREAFCREAGFPPVGRIEALLQDPDLDAILLLTPPNARTEIVEAAAQVGKHILMEKPVERTTAAANRIVETCDRAGVRLGIVFQHRFRAGALALKNLFRDGALGPMATASLVIPWWRPQSYYDAPGRGTLERDGGGVLITQAVHSLDLMLSFTGPVAEVQAMSGTSRLHQMETEDFVGAGLRFANGALGSLTASVTHFPGEQEYMVFNCAHGSAKLSGGSLEVHWRDGRTELVSEDAKTGGGADPMDFPHDWHRAQIEDFIAAIRDGREPVSNGHSALNVHRLIDALLLSSNEGRRVEVAGS